MILKSTMTKLGINTKEDVLYRTFFEEIIENPKLISKLINGFSIERAVDIEKHQATLIKGIEKYILLQDDERYLIETVLSLSNKTNSEETVLSLINFYLKKEAIFDIEKSVNSFDFINELLLNLSVFFNASPIAPIESVRDEYEEKIDEMLRVIEEKDSALKNITRKNRMISERIQIWVDAPKESRQLYLAASLVRNTSEVYYFNFNYRDGELVSKGDIIVNTMRNPEGRQYPLHSPVDGRLIILKEPCKGQGQELVAVIANSEDDIGDIHLWARSLVANNEENK